MRKNSRMGRELARALLLIGILAGLQILISATSLPGDSKQQTSCAEADQASRKAAVYLL